MNMGSPGDKQEKAESKKSMLLLGGALVAAVAVLVVIIMVLLKGGGVVDQVALKVGDNEVTYAQLETYTTEGEKVSAHTSQVRTTVIEYEKNRQMAEKYHIAMPEAYVYGLDGGEGGVQARANAYTKIASYNREFEARLAQQALNGYGILLYDFPVHLTAVEQDAQKATDQVKSVANRFRAQIVEEAQDPLQVLRQVSEYNAENGQSAQTGVRFIVNDETGYDDSATGSVSSDRYLLSQLKGKKTGVTEVQVSGAHSVFFVDILFEQKQQAEAISKVKKDKASMGVIEYDV